MTQPRPHAETIIAWANGAQIQYRTQLPGTDWKDCDDPAFVADYEYRVKPAVTYPQTKLTDGDLWRIYDGVRGSIGAALNAVANAALRHAIDAGQVVTREEFDRAIGDRNKRDMAVAEEVRNRCIVATLCSNLGGEDTAIGKIDLIKVVEWVGK